MPIAKENGRGQRSRLQYLLSNGVAAMIRDEEIPGFTRYAIGKESCERRTLWENR